MLIAAIVNPPSAGPIARLTLKLVLLMAIALSRCSLGASIGVIKSQPGAASAPPTPRKKVVASRMDGVAQWSETTAAKAMEIAATAICEPISRRRASTMSTSAPAGKVSRNIGSEVATWTADTIIGSGSRLVISQLIDVSNMPMPMFEIELAIRMTVKATLLKTPHRDSPPDESDPTLDSVDNWDSARKRTTLNPRKADQP